MRRGSCVYRHFGIELLGSGAGWLYSDPERCALLMGTSSSISFTISTSPTLLGVVATSLSDPFTSSRYHPSGISILLCFNGTKQLLPGAAFHGAIAEVRHLTTPHSLTFILHISKFVKNILSIASIVGSQETFIKGYI